MPEPAPISKDSFLEPRKIPIFTDRQMANQQAAE